MVKKISVSLGVESIQKMVPKWVRNTGLASYSVNFDAQLLTPENSLKIFIWLWVRKQSPMPYTFPPLYEN